MDAQYGACTPQQYRNLRGFTGQISVAVAYVGGDAAPFYRNAPGNTVCGSSIRRRGQPEKGSDEEGITRTFQIPGKKRPAS